MVNWEFFDNQTPDLARVLVDALRVGQPVSPTRGQGPLCNFRQTERILAGFPDHRPDDGQGSKGDAGGPATERPALCFRHRKGDRSRP